MKPICSTNNTEKEDIYQLGVILLEVITGKQITSSSEIEELKEEVSVKTFCSYSDTLRLILFVTFEIIFSLKLFVILEYQECINYLFSTFSSRNK